MELAFILSIINIVISCLWIITLITYFGIIPLWRRTKTKLKNEISREIINTIREVINEKR